MKPRHNYDGERDYKSSIYAQQFVVTVIKAKKERNVKRLFVTCIQIRFTFNYGSRTRWQDCLRFLQGSLSSILLWRGNREVLMLLHGGLFINSVTMFFDYGVVHKNVQNFLEFLTLLSPCLNLCMRCPKCLTPSPLQLGQILWIAPNLKKSE